MDFEVALAVSGVVPSAVDVDVDEAIPVVDKGVFEE